MRRFAVLAVALALAPIVASAFFANAAKAHRSGCHRWHSCPSDTGSYVCGDLGYSRFCPKGSTGKPKATREPKAPGVAKPVPGQFAGKARIIDGDTIDIAGQRIRLHGIDAPEMKQTCRTSKGKEQMCGQLAKQALERLVKGQDVTCKGNTRDRYKRLLAVCYVGPFNINEQMVTDGWAMAYRKYSKDYVKAETFAKSRREGLWRGEFEMPWQWRKERK